MQALMQNPAKLLPDVMNSSKLMNKAAFHSGVDHETLELVHLRASQLNGCSVCVVGHARIAQKGGETDDRLTAIGAWRDAPWFTDAERAALALTEAVTRIADTADPVTDEIWAEAAKHYDEAQLSAILLGVGMVNLWNRINLATKQVAGAAW